jgi:very-short-patch-repair endonuclease
VFVEIHEFADKLRRERTASERKFSELLTNAGVSFKEQAVLDGFIVDFYFPGHEHRIVELDGKFHINRAEKDASRDARLRRQGFKTLRVRSSDVFRQPQWLLHRVLMFLKLPHEPVSRNVRARRKKAKKVKRSPAWAKVPKLTKDQLPKK